VGLLCGTATAGTPASYSQQFAYRMLYQSAAAYCNATSLQNWDCPACAIPNFRVTQVAQSSKWNIQAYTGYDASINAIVVAYRGTEESSIKNWILDLQADHTSTTYPHCDCKVEAGFYEGHEALKPQIVPAVHSLVNQFPSASVYVTGHSLGAAMAVLSAAHLQTQEGVNVDEIYTFGLPRVGDAAFSTWFNQNIPQAIHVTHHDDIVPHLPPELFGYHHTPTEVWYTESSGLNYKVCNGSGEDPSCADSVSVIDFSVADHLVYLDLPICGCKPLGPMPM